MGQSEKIYSTVTEAQTMVKELCVKYAEAMWQVQPEIISVLGVENKERPKSSTKLSKIKAIRGIEKAVFKQHDVSVRYVIELFWSDWNEWSEEQRQWVIFHELLHVSHEETKAIKHDCEDFMILLDAVGVNWFNAKRLPNMLNTQVEFNLDLRPGLDIEEVNKNKKEDEEAAKTEVEDADQSDIKMFDEDESDTAALAEKEETEDLL